ncbi:MAG TPA: DUF2929 family protein [Pseudogracilibacillus sp.]|nr:DUF2929 family protein [Pseudogracilibacillus sp.]
MRFIMTIIWALLIGGAIAYVLSSMADQPFNLTQSVVFSGAVFLFILIIDAVLATREPEK